jgi:hypothetical protein
MDNKMTDENVKIEVIDKEEWTSLSKRLHRNHLRLL